MSAVIIFVVDLSGVREGAPESIRIADLKRRAVNYREEEVVREVEPSLALSEQSQTTRCFGIDCFFDNAMMM